jgi:hypothetical protein
MDNERSEGSEGRYRQLPDLADWVCKAIEYADISQAELSRRLHDYGLHTVDKSAVSKLLKGERRLTAYEMLAISAITKYPMPGAQPPPPQLMGEAAPKESGEKVELSRPAGQRIAAGHLRRLVAKVFELMRPKAMTPVLADNLAAAILLVCHRPPDPPGDEPGEDQLLAQARALITLFFLEPSS